MSLTDGVLVEPVDKENSGETHESLDGSKESTQPPSRRRFINEDEDSIENGLPPLIERNDDDDSSLDSQESNNDWDSEADIPELRATYRDELGL